MKHFFTTLSLGLYLCMIQSTVFGANYEALLNRKPITYEDKPSRALSDRQYKKLSKAQILMGENEFDRAQAILEKLEKSTSKKKHALAQVYQTMAYLFAQKEDYKTSAKFFEKYSNLFLNIYTISIIVEM